jgi:uncharacterized RDD family membrane protein YckC
MEQINMADNQTGASQTAQPEYAGFWTRYFAQLIDIAVWSLNFFIPLYLLSTFATASLEKFVPGLLWFLLYALFAGPVIKFFVHPWLISNMGAGLGKLVCGLEIVNQTYSRLTYRNALFREYIAKIASNALLGLGYYWITKTPQRQGWHDGLAGTYVVKKHSGGFAGFMSLLLFLAIIAGLTYKSVQNFINAKTLQYDMATMVTQIQQDFTEDLPDVFPEDIAPISPPSEI